MLAASSLWVCVPCICLSLSVFFHCRNRFGVCLACFITSKTKLPTYVISSFLSLLNWFILLFYAWQYKLFRGVYFAPTISFKCILSILSLVLTSQCVGVKYTPLNSRLFRLHLCIARLFLKKGRRGSHGPCVTQGRGAGDGQPVPLVDHHHMAIPILQSTPS